MRRGQSVRILGHAPLADTDRLRPNPLNDNRQSPFMFGKLKATILADGFADPIVVRSGDGGGPFEGGALEIIGGEHRWRAALDLGMPQVPVHDLGAVDDLTARKLLVTLNRVRGESDQDKLSRLLREINSDGGAEALASLPFDDEALAEMLDGEQASSPSVTGDAFEDEVPVAVEASGAASARDLLVLLQVQGLRSRELAGFLESVRQWAYSRPDLARPAWQDLADLLRSRARPAPP